MKCNLALSWEEHDSCVVYSEEFRGREKKLYMCFVNLEKAFDRVPRKVMEWALRKKG